MIRYRIVGVCPEEASLLARPALRRLAGRGPWACLAVGDGTILARGEASAWGPWQPGLDGLEYALAEPLPPWDEAWLRRIPGAALVPLRNGLALPVVPVPFDGVGIDLINGDLGEPVSGYGLACAAAWELLIGPSPVPANHPTLLTAVREILLRSTTLPLEALAAYAVVGTADVMPIVEAAAALPKAWCGAGGSPAAPLASTPPA
jgi:hypothetical protein